MYQERFCLPGLEYGEGITVGWVDGADAQTDGAGLARLPLPDGHPYRGGLRVGAPWGDVVVPVEAASEILLILSFTESECPV